MQISSHADKIGRLLRLQDRLDPLPDFELWYWTCLTAGTNIWNASLHAVGLTSEDRAFSTIPGVHVVPLAGGGWRRELRGPGDVSHAGWPAIPGDLPEPLQCLEAALHALEQHRDPCLRGDRQPTQAIVDECRQALSRALSVYRTVVRPQALPSEARP
ncbi:hypothetical protein [Achromobacter insolitus]|uniref:Uncharacterized protein n=1 Tax=Achromobacter insolitus TaxID=217204 RepID=A0A6S7EZF9_9BURK|nr:hypothetical protein [Achromobacter insolitus]MDQ6214778.1 hypothetical protein [Achromobacter insolitus]CAB3931173.1 hypothetical protein LMG6000_02019 [Achromobacter insolitus]CAB3947358.1 hypothetical protein LMG5997_06134 [Achromobacter insolitus]